MTLAIHRHNHDVTRTSRHRRGHWPPICSLWVAVTRQRRLLACLSIVTTLFAADAWAQNDPVFDAKGFQQNHDYFSALPFEHVDTVTGGLVLTFTDLVLPGNAGRDLRFQRSYNSKGGQWTFGIAGLVLQVGKSHYEVYKSKRDFENGVRDRAVWEDGRLKEEF